MTTKILLVIAIVIGALNLWQISETPQKLILVSETQKQCLDLLAGIDYELTIFGPEIFQHHTLVSLSSYGTGNFTQEFSGCFYDSHSDNIDYSQIPETVSFLKSTGSEYTYFYKPISETKLVVYGVSK